METFGQSACKVRRPCKNWLKALANHAPTNPDTLRARLPLLLFLLVVHECFGVGFQHTLKPL